MILPWIFIALGAIAGFTATICAVVVAAKMLQHNQTVLGIITLISLFFCSIGYILALVFGWQNRQAWGLQKVMPILTGSIILAFVLFGAGCGMMIPQWKEEFEKQQQQMEQFDESEFDFEIPSFED